MTTRVVHCKKESYDVYIGRPGRWGNPFNVAIYGREGAIEHYCSLFNSTLRNDPIFVEEIQALRGKTLGCWCKPKACHGDVIAEYLDGTVTGS